MTSRTMLSTADEHTHTVWGKDHSYLAPLTLNRTKRYSTSNSRLFIPSYSSGQFCINIPGMEEILLQVDIDCL